MQLAAVLALLLSWSPLAAQDAGSDDLAHDRATTVEAAPAVPLEHAEAEPLDAPVRRPAASPRRVVPPPESLEELRNLQARFKAAATRASPATVAVRVGSGQGSGVIVSSDGLVLTAAHVAGRPGRDVTFIFPDGSTARGRTLGMDPQLDCGMMRITTKGDWPHVELGDSASLTAGQWMVSLGHPGGYLKGRPPVVRAGRLVYGTGTVLWSDATLVGGDSGGPLLDLEGKLIGIHSRIGRPTFSNFHVPLHAFQDRWERMLRGDVIEPGPQPYMGIVGETLEAGGVRVQRVLDESGAAAADLQPGDIITAINGKRIVDLERLVALIQASNVGDVITVTVDREGKLIEKRVELHRRAPEPER